MDNGDRVSYTTLLVRETNLYINETVMDDCHGERIGMLPTQKRRLAGVLALFVSLVTTSFVATPAQASVIPAHAVVSASAGDPADCQSQATPEAKQKCLEQALQLRQQNCPANVHPVTHTDSYS